ncbi:hypothetical protein V8E53_008321 [Lactarius tabidus]
MCSSPQAIEMGRSCSRRTHWHSTWYRGRELDPLRDNKCFPQPVGIAGGRPSTSYYFVGSQADNLFLLGPHHTRTTIPLRPPTQTRERDRDRGIPNPN